jgi:putative transposase
VEKAVVNTVMESYLQGISTRRIQENAVHLEIDQLSLALVSQMARDLDDQVQAFLLRSIEQLIPYFFVDASYYKVVRQEAVSWIALRYPLRLGYPYRNMHLR